MKHIGEQMGGVIRFIITNNIFCSTVHDLEEIYDLKVITTFLLFFLCSCVECCCSTSIKNHQPCQQHCRTAMQNTGCCFVLLLGVVGVVGVVVLVVGCCQVILNVVRKVS